MLASIRFAQQQVAQCKRLPHLLVALGEDIFIDEALLGNGCAQRHDLGSERCTVKEMRARKVEQCCADEREKPFERETAKRHRRQSAMQEDVARQRPPGELRKLIWTSARQRAPRVKALDASGDGRALQDQLFSIVLSGAERNRFGEVLRRIVWPIQRLIGIRKIIVTGGIVGIGSDSVFQRFGCGFVPACRLQN